MEVNDAAVVAAVAAAFAAYEAALVADDKAALAGWFWASAETVRFGIADSQVGAARLREWRDSQPPLPPGRRLADTRIVAFGADCAVVTTLFGYPGREVVGRQSQTWVRFPAGWRIVSAHVSEVAHLAAAPAG
jgi:Protein of unknown function (DUF3225)